MLRTAFNSSATSGKNVSVINQFAIAHKDVEGLDHCVKNKGGLLCSVGHKGHSVDSV